MHNLLPSNFEYELLYQFAPDIPGTRRYSVILSPNCRRTLVDNLNTQPLLISIAECWFLSNHDSYTPNRVFLTAKIMTSSVAQNIPQS